MNRKLDLFKIIKALEIFDWPLVTQLVHNRRQILLVSN